MPRNKHLSVPTKAPLSHIQRLPISSPDISKTLSKLTRSSLISLALEWLSPRHVALCAPYLKNDEEQEDDDEEAPYEAAESIDELQEIYEELEQRKGGKKEVVERIIEGDWRKGITLYQLAMADSKNILDHSATQRWSALLIRGVSSSNTDKDDYEQKLENPLPRVHAQTFLANLQTEIAPLSKAYYYLTRLESRSATLLRIYLLESPYNSEKSLHDLSAKSSASQGDAKTIFVLFPDNTPYVYVSHAASTSLAVGLDARSLQGVVLEAISNALSKPRERYVLKSTSLSAKSLDTLFTLRGSGRSNAAQGGWSIFISDTFGVPALDFSKPALANITKPRDQDKENANPDTDASKPQSTSKRKSEGASSPAKRRRIELAASRFGLAGLSSDTAILERLDIRIADPFPAIPPSKAAEVGTTTATRDRANAPTAQQSNKSKRGRKSRPSLLDEIPLDSQENDRNWRPDVRISFQGPHVIAGIRELVEAAVVDGEKMPAWMTGEAAVSIGVVKNGRIVGK